jgi:Tfp pilus assembly protein PilX
MLTRARLHGENGSVMVTALMVMAIMIPIGLALLSIVDTQSVQSGRERTRDRAFNLADSALQSAAFSLGQAGWPATAALAPSNSASGSSMSCGLATYGATSAPPRTRVRRPPGSSPTSTPATTTRPTPAPRGRSTSATTT